MVSISLSNEQEKVVTYTEQTLPPLWLQKGKNTIAIIGNRYKRIYLTESSGVLRSQLKNLIDSSRELVCISSFLFADNILLESITDACRRGVRVYMLTASETQLKEPRADNEFEYERLQEHIRILDLLAGRALIRTGENLHSKFLLIDPVSDSPRGFLLTANLTSDALTRNVELGVELTPAEVRDLFRQFRIGFWEESSNELLESGSLNRVDRIKGSDLPLPLESLSTTSRSHSIKDKVEFLIKSAKSEIIITTYGIDLTHETTKMLLAAIQSGKRVRILARPRPSKTTMSALITLAEAGAQVRGHPWIHAKSVLVDTNSGWTGLIMTANIEENGLSKGFESGITFSGEDATQLQTILETWWETFPLQLYVKTKLGDIEGEAQFWENDKLRKVSIKKSGEQPLGSYEKPVKEWTSFIPSLTQKKQIENETLFHEIKFSWTVTLPKLPNGAVKVDHIPSPATGASTYEAFKYGLDFTLYKSGKELFVVLHKPEKLSSAMNYANELSATLVTI